MSTLAWIVLFAAILGAGASVWLFAMWEVREKRCDPNKKR